MTRQLLFRTFATIVSCLALALPANAYDLFQDGIYYDLSGTNATVTHSGSYNSYSGTVNIPATVTNNGTTYTVKTIGYEAFKNCANLVRIVMPNTVEYMSNYAFQNCTSLINVTIPASMYTIYYSVFEGCTSLKTVICLRSTARSCNVNNFPSAVYSGATLYVPKGSLSSYQTTGCWSSFTTIKEIGCDFVEDAIFYNDLGDNKAEVTYVHSDYNYFSNFYSGDVNIPATVTHGGNTYTVTSIHRDAFYYCHYLYSVSLPATVNSIGNYAFYDCTNLTSFNIPEGVEDINYCAFGGCTKLERVFIPTSVTWIAQNAFANCFALTSITCRAKTPPMCVDSSSFPTEAYNNATLSVPSTALSDYQSASVWQNFSSIEGKDYDFEDNGIYYVITGPNTASVTYKDTNFNCYSGGVNIPTTVTHEGTLYTVTAIGRSAFRECPDLTSVSIPSTVTVIDYAAFYKCTGLTSITVPSDVVSIGEFAFRESGLRQVTLRNGVTRIGRAAFYNCEALTGISIPNSVIELGDLCFQNCTSLTSASIGTGLTEIPHQCFTMCSALSSVSIPSTVKIYRNFSFYNTGFTSLNITAGVDSIGYSAFGDCMQLTSITFPASAKFIDNLVLTGCDILAVITVNSGNPNYCAIDNVLYNKAQTRLMRYAPQIPNNYATIPNTCVAIATGAFDGAVNLDKITIGSNVANIGYNAFNRCLSLTAFDIADGNTHYMTDDGVLYSRDSAGKPQSIIKYPANRPDKHYSVLNTTDTVSSYAFAQTSKLQSVYIPKQLKELESSSFTNSSAKRVVIDEGLTRIPEYAFDECESLQSIYVPSTVTSIGEQAFVYAFELSELTFAGTTPPAIEAHAFYGAGYDNSNPVTIYAPAGASSAYSSHDWNSNYFEYTINQASTLPSATTFTVDSLNYQTTDANLNAMVTGVTSNAIVDPGIPPKVAYQGNLCTVTTFKDHAFANCTKMKRAEVPFTVTTIEDYAFYNSTNIERIKLHEGLLLIDQFSLSHINALTSLTIPASVDSIGGTFATYSSGLQEILVEPANSKYTSVDGVLFSKDKKLLVAFPNDKANNYAIPNGTVTIGTNSFRGDSRLQQVTIPKSVRKIESSAFWDNTALTSITIPTGVEVIATGAFGNCTAMTQADLPSTLTELGYNAFYNVTNLNTLYVRATTPPVCKTYNNPRTGEHSESFIDDHYTNVQLIVPTGCAQAYQQANTWKKFQHISETDFPSDAIRGDVNGDGQVNIADVTALIDLLLSGNTNNNPGADANQDNMINIADVTSLIDYLLSGAWPEPAPIDMWYLWGNFIGSQPWGDIYDNHQIGISALPLYPVGDFDAHGKGILSWTGFVTHSYFTIVHKLTSYNDIVSEMWVMNNNTGQYSVQNMVNEDPNYSCLMLDADYYTITLDTRTMTLSIEPYHGEAYSFGGITMPGSYNGWVNTANTMNSVNTTIGLDNHDWWVDEWTMPESNSSFDYEFKFCTYDDWTYNWGSTDFPYGTGVQDGMNIPAQAGTYIVFFNDITGQYNFIKK